MRSQHLALVHLVFFLVSLKIICACTCNFNFPNTNNNARDSSNKLTSDNLTQYVSKFLGHPSGYRAVQQILETAIRNYAASSANEQKQSSSCLKEDSWTTNCGIPALILNDLLLLNKTYGMAGVCVCPTSIRLVYKDYGALALTFLFKKLPGSCMSNYQIIVNGDHQNSKTVAVNTLSMMINSIVCLIRAVRRPKDRCDIQCKNSHILIDINSGIFYTRNTIFPIVNPVLVINNGKTSFLNLYINNDEYEYQIHKSKVLSLKFLRSYFLISEAALYFENIANIAVANEDRKTRSENYFFIKRKCNGEFGFFCSIPLASHEKRCAVSYDRPAVELNNPVISLADYSICANTKSDCSLYITITMTRSKISRKILSLLLKLM